MGQSLAQQVASLPAADQEAILADLDQASLEWDWDFWSRPEQRAPDGDWNVWIYMAGRGAGKTRSAAEWVRDEAKNSAAGGKPLQFGLIARTAADVRDVLVQGESGILNVSPPSEMPEYQPSLRKLTWPNGNTALCFTADEPDQIRGPQFHRVWCDELASWRQLPDASGLTAWDNIRIAARLGAHPKIIATTTPKRVDVMRKLIKEAEEHPERVVITRGSTDDNRGNLSQAYVDGIYGIYAGTRLALQELSGEMLDDVEGALWNEQMIEDFRATAAATGTPLRVVGVDPTVAERPGDECGIVVCTATADRDLYRRQAWVLEDASILGSPETWAQRVVDTARRWSCPVVAETNQGGALVRSSIQSIDPNIKVYEVHAKQGKQLRAEPVALAYEQGRVHHLGVLPDLETQMTQWIPQDTKSPDRIDALVHALTALLITPPKGFGGGPITAKSPSRHRVPSARAAAAPGRRAGGGKVFSARGGGGFGR